MKNPLSSSFGRKDNSIDHDMLDAIAADALTYLAAKPERLDGFFAVTGLSVDTLRHAAGTREFTTHLLDHMTSDERRLLGFATESGRDPAAIEAIRAALAPPDYD